MKPASDTSQHANHPTRNLQWGTRELRTGHRHQTSHQNLKRGKKRIKSGVFNAMNDDLFDLISQTKQCRFQFWFYWLVVIFFFFF